MLPLWLVILIIIVILVPAAAIGIAAMGALFAINACALWLLWSYHLP